MQVNIRSRMLDKVSINHDLLHPSSTDCSRYPDATQSAAAYSQALIPLRWVGHACAHVKPVLQIVCAGPFAEKPSMKYPTSLRQSLLLLFLGMTVLPAWASDDCDAPVNRWQTREALRQWASVQGWKVQRLKIDDGCYEVHGIDAEGRTFKAKIDPETLKVLKIKNGNHQPERSRDSDVESAGRHTRPSQSDGNAVQAPFLAPGTTPSQVK